MINPILTGSSDLRIEGGSIGGNNRLAFGDGTGGTNARAEVTFYRFQQATPVPEPSTYLLLGFGFIGMLYWRRWVVNN